MGELSRSACRRRWSSWSVGGPWLAERWRHNVAVSTNWPLRTSRRNSRPCRRRTSQPMTRSCWALSSRELQPWLPGGPADWAAMPRRTADHPRRSAVAETERRPCPVTSDCRSRSTAPSTCGPRQVSAACCEVARAGLGWSLSAARPGTQHTTGPLHTHAAPKTRSVLRSRNFSSY